MKKSKVISLLLILSFFAFLMEAEKAVKPHFKRLKDIAQTTMHLEKDSIPASALNITTLLAHKNGDE